jgi:DoxX-like family
LTDPILLEDRQNHWMSTIAVPSRSETFAGWKYWMPIGLLCLTFLASAALTTLDPDGTRVTSTKLGFPTFLAVYPLAAAKLLAVVAILWRKSKVLTHFAFAGLLYDMLLALGGHIDANDFPSGYLAVFGLVVWVVAFRASEQRAY